MAMTRALFRRVVRYSVVGLDLRTHVFFLVRPLDSGFVLIHVCVIGLFGWA